jgi:hypothetical protein
MGGDDLDNDGEYMAAAALTRGDHDDSSSDNDIQSLAMEGVGPVVFNEDKNVVISDDISTPGSNKRKHDCDSSSQQPQKLSPQKRSKKDCIGGSLRTIGTKILEESARSQAELLSQYSGAPFSLHHIAMPIPNPKNQRDSYSSNFMDRLLTVISKKQLRTKTTIRSSPKAVIVCLSARRCVAVLKDLVPLRLRISKLFPKQGTVIDQALQLESTDFGLAVGTPSRIKELIERGSLSLNGTILFGLDIYENDKSFSVYTMPDTSPPTQDLLKDHVYPRCCFAKNQNKNGKITSHLKVSFL